jgi:sec-independent protein translocase protein TatA
LFGLCIHKNCIIFALGKVGETPTMISYNYLKYKKIGMSTVLFLSPSIIVIILLVVLLLFGGKKIPELFKGIGQGIKGFKDEVKDDKDDK